MSDEEYVRSVWDDVGIKWGKLEGVRYGMAHAAGKAIPLHGYETENEIWSAAAEFTRKRLEQVRQIEEEIAITSVDLGFAKTEHTRRVYSSILVREQAALAELKRGMK